MGVGHRGGFQRRESSFLKGFAEQSRTSITTRMAKIASKRTEPEREEVVFTGEGK